MLFDFRTCARQEFRADVCAIGAGAAGLAFASLLAPSGCSTLVVESGNRRRTSAADEFSHGVSDPPGFAGLTAGRARALGGTTRRWSGGCIRLDPIDFETRDWVPWSGWPFGPDHLAPFYRMAADLLDLGRPIAVEDALRRSGLDEQTLGSDDIEPKAAVFCPRPDFSKLLSKAIASERLHVVTNATATRIDTNEEGTRVESIEVSSLCGQKAIVRARYYVLCAGAIENARILLSSQGRDRPGLGNRHGLVGRFFQDHPSGIIGEICAHDVPDLQRRFSYALNEGRLIWPRLALSAARQTEARVLNAYGYPVAAYEGASLPSVLKQAARLVRRRRTPGEPAAADARTGPPSRLLARCRMSALAPLFKADRLRLQVVTEQAPDPDNRITLTDETDQLSIPKVKLTWRIGEAEQRTVRMLGERLRGEFGRWGFGRLELHDFLYGPDVSLNGRFRDTYHHAGTTRMADDPRRGVVDRDCRIHGMTNLYVSGGSVMPTSGAANPTFTIVALALRLGEHLKDRLWSAA